LLEGVQRTDWVSLTELEKTLALIIIMMVIITFGYVPSIWLYDKIHSSSRKVRK